MAGHPALAIPSREGSRVTQIDLDLDVIRRLDGAVEIIDRDEFDEIRVSRGYPDELVEAAIEAADRAVALLHADAEPFHDVAAGWIERAASLD